MRFAATCLAVLLGTWALLAAPPAEAAGTLAPATAPVATAAPAAAPGSPGAAAQPATDAEADAYALREADSPELREFVGGDVLVEVLVIVLLVVLILYIADRI